MKFFSLPRSSTIRPIRVAADIKRFISDFFSKQDLSTLLKDSLFSEKAGLICVSNVKISPDLKHATIFITIFPNEKVSYTFSLLERCAPKIRHLLGQKLKLRFTPLLRFSIDHSYEYGSRIDEIIKSFPPVLEDEQPSPPLKKKESDIV